jgi:putative ATP-binding cassette transporter
MAAPAASEWMVLPQQPYLALGSLRDQLLYTLPPGAGALQDEELRRALIQARLEPLLRRYPDLDTETDWEQVLSGGEQQRLGFARLLLRRPAFVMLDEATSALDLASEEHLYGLLHRARMAVISVGHRPSLTAFHERMLRLDGQGGWSLEAC